MEQNKRTKFEVADVLKMVDTTKGYSSHQQKVFKDIIECRTSALGGHAKVCTNVECGKVEMAYNSCRNRACPKCGWRKQQEWIIKIARGVLPARHFHTVFTIPHEFNNFFLYNKKEFSNLLFKASSKAVLDLIKHKWKLKGAFTAVLHTWGADLKIHPHIHMIVPAGGFCIETGEWRGFRKQYLANKEALALRFRAVFMKGIKKLIKKGVIKIPSCHGYLKSNEADFLDFFNKPHEKEWNVFVKKSFCGEQKVIKYLGRYIHRTGISNSRILDISGGKVSFLFKNYRTGNFRDTKTMNVDEFVRKFSYHICDKRFVRVRHGGMYSACVKADSVLVSRLSVYGEKSVPVEVLKEVYKIESRIEKNIELNSICRTCFCSVDLVFEELLNSA